MYICGRRISLHGLGSDSFSALKEQGPISGWLCAFAASVVISPEASLWCVCSNTQHGATLPEVSQQYASSLTSNSAFIH